MTDDRRAAVTAWEADLGAHRLWLAAHDDEFLVLADAAPFARWRASVTTGATRGCEAIGHVVLVADGTDQVIDELHVEPAWRRRGIATRVLGHLGVAHDALGHDLAVLPARLDGCDAPLPLAALHDWYGRHGYVLRADQAYLVRPRGDRSAARSRIAALLARRAARLDER